MMRFLNDHPSSSGTMEIKCVYGTHGAPFQRDSKGCCVLSIVVCAVGSWIIGEYEVSGCFGLA